MRNWGLLVNIWQEVRWPDDLMFVRLHFPYICGYRTKRQKNTFLNVFFSSRSTAIFSFICCICTFELELHLSSCNCTCDQKDTFSVPHKVWKGTVCQMPTFCQHTKKSPSSCPATVDLIICVIQLFLRDPAHHRLGQHRCHFLARSAVSRLLLESAVLWSIEAEPKFWICCFIWNSDSVGTFWLFLIKN